MRQKRNKPCKTPIPTSQPLQEPFLLTQPASQAIKSQKLGINWSGIPVEVRETQAGPWLLNPIPCCCSPTQGAHPAGTPVQCCCQPGTASRESSVQHSPSWAELMLIKRKYQCRIRSQRQQDSPAVPESPRPQPGRIHSQGVPQAMPAPFHTL